MNPGANGPNDFDPPTRTPEVGNTQRPLERRSIQEANDHRPTVVVISSVGFVVRNYLLGGFLDSLRQRVRVFVCSPLHGEETFQLMMRQRGAEVHSLENPKRNRAWRRCQMWRHDAHVAYMDNATWRMKHSARHHDIGWRERIINGGIHGVFRVISGPRLLGWMDRWETRRALGSPTAAHYREWFEDIRPSLVFSPAPLMRDEWIPLQAARAMGIRTALAVQSWDNLSSKARLPLPCDALLVWSPAMREEAQRLYPEIPAERIHIVGPPQFDYYYRPEYRMDRESFLKSLGGDPARPLVVYAGVTPGLMPEEHEIVAHLARDIREGRVKGRPQLLVRLHPKDDGNRYRELKKAFPEMMLTIPGRDSGASITHWHPDEEDIRSLVNTVRHADVLINVASTMTIDAALMDRPVVNIRYHFRPPEARPPWGVFIYDTAHYAPLMTTGGFRMAHSPSELVDHVNRYLDDPSLDRDGRRRLAGRVCGTLDGRAGERSAETLLRLLPRPRPIGPEEPPLVIPEVGIHHEGDVRKAALQGVGRLQKPKRTRGKGAGRR